MGTLAEADAAGFEEHLVVCARCLAVVEATDVFVRAIRSAARELRWRPGEISAHHL
jgi:hypothetical protein